jgi:hypothetical protein
MAWSLLETLDHRPGNQEEESEQHPLTHHGSLCEAGSIGALRAPSSLSLIREISVIRGDSSLFAPFACFVVKTIPAGSIGAPRAPLFLLSVESVLSVVTLPFSRLPRVS